ncbi:MAG: phosphoglucosamine mutase [Ruminococcaceae bacterium]|nr:phosphoglucosamine mutase [Oscillospiraceae bacterium]
MGKLFGTDGIRGIANETLTCEMAFRVGQAAAIVLGEKKEGKPLFLIGRDTRISGDMLESCLVAGLCSCGANVLRLGVIPTPGVAYLTVLNHADAGIVISASHNPYAYNGIKIFSGEGFKLNDDLEAHIEELILSGEALPVKTGGEIGKAADGTYQSDEYIRYLASKVEEQSLFGLRVLIDCANGAASATAKRLFRRYPMNVEFIHDTPDGVNINAGCGSTHLQDLSRRVVEGCYDVGIAFDGDADRCLAVDENGTLVDGDHIMAICAQALRAEGKLPGDGFVATVMSNLGLHKYVKANGLKMLCADVGDRNVLEMMQREGMCLGGEQSGHVIFLDDLTTGDGQLCALHFLSILASSGKSLSELSGEIPTYPQILLNVPGPHNAADKQALLTHPDLQTAIDEKNKEMDGDGRILVRASGTEALIRVMVEASTQVVAEHVAEDLVNIVESIQKIK